MAYVCGRAGAGGRKSRGEPFKREQKSTCNFFLISRIMFLVYQTWFHIWVCVCACECVCLRHRIFFLLLLLLLRLLLLLLLQLLLSSTLYRFGCHTNYNDDLSESRWAKCSDRECHFSVRLYTFVFHGRSLSFLNDSNRIEHFFYNNWYRNIYDAVEVSNSTQTGLY